MTEAYYWSSLAAIAGDPEAAANRDLVAMEMEPKDIATILKKATSFKPSVTLAPTNSISTNLLNIPLDIQAAPPATKAAVKGTNAAPAITTNSPSSVTNTPSKP